MFDNDPDDEPSLEELFETGDSDSLDEHESTDTESSVDSNDSEPDWADSILDDDDIEAESSTNEASETTQTETESVEMASTDTSGTTQASTPVTSASGTAHEAGETSLVLSKSSLPTLPFSLDPSESGPDWLPRVLSGIRYVIRKTFFIIMAPVIFLLVFLGTFFAYFVPGLIALSSFLAVASLWILNPFEMAAGGRFAWTIVLTIIFFGAVYAGMRLSEIYE